MSTPSTPRGGITLAVVRTLFLDAGLAVGAYLLARALGQTPFVALLAGTLAAGLRAGYVIARHRRADPFSIFMLVVFAVGLVLSFATGSPRFLLAKESVGTFVAGAAFLVTCLTGKPLAYHAAQRVAAPTAELRAEWAGLWRSEPVFRHRFRLMSVVFGTVLVLEAAVRVLLVLVLPIDLMAVLSPLMTPVVITAVSVWAVHYGQGTEAAVRASHAEAPPATA